MKRDSNFPVQKGNIIFLIGVCIAFEKYVVDLKLIFIGLGFNTVD
jgi:hypothetical protein